METNTYSRTKYEATLDLHYLIRLHLLCRRWYLRLRAGTAIVSLLAGSAAVVGAVQANPRYVAVAGVLVAVASACDIVCGWADRAARHDQARREVARALAMAPGMQLADIESALAGFDGDFDDEVESLRNVAYNDTVRTHGRGDYVQPETLGNWFARLIV